MLFRCSGLAVEPNTNNNNNNDNAADAVKQTSDSIFDLAESAGAASGKNENETDAPVRRTITMYREGFVVDDGPYRRLDDPSNRGFLRSLARGQTPEELRGDANGPGGNTTVGLVDKRNQDYVETFRSFSGAGQSLAASSNSNSNGASASGVFDPSSLPVPSTDEDATQPTTSIAVRMLDGSRRVVTIALGATVQELAARVVAAASSAASSSSSVPFRIVAGFPPKPLQDGSQTVEAAGLKGARVQLQKA